MHQPIAPSELPEILVLEEPEATITAPAPTLALPPLRFDFEEYRKYVEDENLTEAQARELLGAIWLIITGFVDLGFRLDPVQQAMDARAGPVHGNDAVLAADSRRVVSCRNTFNTAAKTRPARRKRRAARRKDS